MHDASGASGHLRNRQTSYRRYDRWTLTFSKINRYKLPKLKSWGFGRFVKSPFASDTQAGHRKAAVPSCFGG